MIKLIVAVKRNPAMSPAEFHRYWRTEHAQETNASFADMAQSRFLVTREEEVT